jgi:hypothetical protein
MLLISINKNSIVWCFGPNIIVFKVIIGRIGNLRFSQLDCLSAFNDPSTPCSDPKRLPYILNPNLIGSEGSARTFFIVA